MALKVKTFNMFSDNFGFLLIDDTTKKAALVDPGDAGACIQAVTKSDADLVAIFNTHHHSDHSGGNRKILNEFGNLDVFAGARDMGRIGTATRGLNQGDQVKLGETAFAVFYLPGHTMGHIAYYGDGKLFCGDTLFVGGCGRLFEGSPDQMFASLQQLAKLPGETEIYCAHEYTVNNLSFALSIRPGDPGISSALSQAKKTIAAGGRTVPSTIAAEKNHNIFLQSQNVEEFARLRRLKDQY